MGVDGMNSADIFDEYFDNEKPKYIIKNCPCYNNERFLSGFLDDKDTICTYYSKNCQDCTDCVLKQIVELCKSQKASSIFAVFLADRILKLLDIQEVE